MSARTPGVWLWLGLLTAISMCLAGCGNGEEQTRTQKQPPAVRVQVVVAGPAEVRVPCPVVLEGVQVGRVVDKSLSSRGRPILILELQPRYQDQLQRPLVFYLQDSPARLVATDCDKAPVDPSHRVFLGFGSYARFLAWRTKLLASHTYQQAKEFVSGLLEEASSLR